MEKYKINTYGCQMNVHESEKIAGILEEMGLTACDDDAQADVIVFNTCCIRDTAEKRALGNIGAIKQLKKQNKNLIVAVCGCMTQQDDAAEELKKRFPFVDIVLGTANIGRLGFCIEQKLLSGVSTIEVIKDEKPEVKENEPIFRTSGTNAWLNIMYGCNNFCTYCIVPFVRGRERSRKMETVLADYKRLIDEGYKEITLLGQNVNSYGSDLEEGYDFAKLLKEIDNIGGEHRVRFMTSHPKDINMEIVDIIAQSKVLCNNIHLPVQAGSNKILELMNRHYSREYYLDIIEKIRSKMPDCGITTDIMVGFPQETDKDFEDTLDLVRKVKYSNAFTFIYSPRRGTKAAMMPQVPYEIKRERIMELIKLQNSITKEISKQYEGSVVKVLCEDVNLKKTGFVCGRTDSGRMVNFKGDSSMIGSFCDVLITKSQSASLFGEVKSFE